MKIIIAGCGKIGETLLGALAREGHDLVAMDIKDSVISELTNKIDAMCICGDAVNCNDLNEIGVEKADLLIATTGSDELNMLSCFLAKRMGVRHTIARVRNPEYRGQVLSFIRDQLDLSMVINPELLTAQTLYHMLKLPSAVKVETFSRNNFEMIELVLRADSPLCGTPLWTLREKHKAKFLICVVQRGDDVIIPGGNFVLQVGDRIGLTGTPSEIQRLFKSMGLAKRLTRNVMIMGGSRIAFYLTRMLLNAGSRVKIIDQDHAILKRFTDDYPEITTAQGNGTHQDLLLEEGLMEQDAFVALTGMDEENILISFYARTQNLSKVITKINRDEMVAMARQMGLESIVSPKDIVLNVVLGYIRALQKSMGSSIETLYQLMDGKAEAVEFVVNGSSALTGIPLKELKLKKNILLGGIIRERKPIIPTGDDVILPGDRVVVISGEHRLTGLTDILM